VLAPPTPQQLCHLQQQHQPLQQRRQPQQQLVSAVLAPPALQQDCLLLLHQQPLQRQQQQQLAPPALQQRCDLQQQDRRLQQHQDPQQQLALPLTQPLFLLLLPQLLLLQCHLTLRCVLLSGTYCNCTERTWRLGGTSCCGSGRR
jgi:hypothetical protein